MLIYLDYEYKPMTILNYSITQPTFLPVTKLQGVQRGLYDVFKVA